MDNIRITNTPYDDVFRTLLNDCSSLIIPVINEMFGEHYSGQETDYGYLFQDRRKRTKKIPFRMSEQY